MEFAIFIIIFIAVVYGYIKLSDFNSITRLKDLEMTYFVETGNLTPYNTYLYEKCSPDFFNNRIADFIGALVIFSFIVLLVVDVLTVYFVNTTNNTDFIFYVADAMNVLWLIFVTMMVNPLCKLLCHQYFGAPKLIRHTLDSMPEHHY